MPQRALPGAITTMVGVRGSRIFKMASAKSHRAYLGDVETILACFGAPCLVSSSALPLILAALLRLPSSPRSRISS